MTDHSLEQLPSTGFAVENIRERDDLQRVLRRDIQVLGDDLLLVAEEYDLFQDSRRRVDLLALDRTGRLVVVELKRTDSGGHMELQALRYAAMVSTMNPRQLIAKYADTHDVELDEARAAIAEHIDDEDLPDRLPDDVRIVLVSRDFSQEITATVLWLRSNYSLDISCYRLVPYRIGADLVIDLEQLIPLREASEFQVQQRQKQTAAMAARATGRDFTKYDLHLGEQVQIGMSKQAVLKAAIQGLQRAGVPLDAIRDVTRPGRWLPVTPQPGETVEQAFTRTHPDQSTTHRWFDLDPDEKGTVWVIPRFGGLDVEPFAAALTTVARGHTTFAITPSRSDPTEEVGTVTARSVVSEP